MYKFHSVSSKSTELLPYLQSTAMPYRGQSGYSLACVLLRNICDSINKESIKALQLKRNEFVHNPSPLDQDEFELLWRKGKTSLCDVINDEELRQQICKEADDIYSYMFRDLLTRYIGKMSRSVEQEELPTLHSSNVPKHDN